MPTARHEVHPHLPTAAPYALSDGWSRRFVPAMLLLFSWLHAGCATLTIPAIDPSGNRIFAPVPTQLTLPQLHGPTGTSVLPNASFPEPAPPPACLQAPTAPSPAVTSANPVRSSDERGRCGQLLLTPTRIVAPVGGEVVLIAGVCGEDGYLVTGEPIEWMLAPDGVGEIIEVGDDLKGKRRSSWNRAAKPSVEKLDVDFARGRTSAEAGRITRGSQRTSDDLVLKKGQTWISLTSPTEGNSRVTVLAPDSDVWDRRRQTATIYWVDASWQFPPPIPLRLGEVATLVTRVTKAEGFAPAEDWIVRYRILNDSSTQFLTPPPPGLMPGDTLVNADGKAIMQLAGPADRPATAIVAIEIARPKDAEAKMPELPIARGQSIVTWSAPLLQLDVAGSEVARVGQPVDYRISLANAGDISAENVRVTMNLGNEGLRAEYDQGKLPSQQSNLGAVWDQGVIPARRILEIFVRITPTAESDNRIVFTATASPNFSVTKTVVLQALKPQVELSFAPIPGMEQVEIGQPTIFQVIAKNIGRTSLNNLSLLIQADPGLRHAETGSNEVSRVIPFLPPQQPQELNVRFIVQKSGELPVKLIAQADGLPLAERTSFVRGIEAKPRQANMTAQLRTPGGSNVLAPNTDTIVEGIIENRGQTLLTNLQMLFEYEPSLQLVNHSNPMQHLSQNRQLTWAIPSLEAGKRLTVQMLFRAIGTSPPPAVRFTARSDGGINAQDLLQFNVQGATGEQPVLPTSPSDRDIMPTPGSGALTNPPATNNPWSLLIVPIESQVAVGQSARYAVSFQNNRPQADQNVSLDFNLPQGVQVIGCVFPDGTPIQTSRSPDGSVLQLNPFQSLRPNEAIRIILELKHDVPANNQILEAVLRSAADPQGTRQQARIHVLPNIR